MSPERARANAPLTPDAECPYLRLDTEGAWSFLIGALKDIGGRFPIEAISIATHGAAGALVSDEGLALPPMDYEFDGFAPVDAGYDAARPPFAETFSPHLPRGLNLGRQPFYLGRMFPAEFAGARRVPPVSPILGLAAQRRDGDRGHVDGDAF